MKSLAIIPARGGSKGVPNKNSNPINGKPLIGYSIEAAQKSKLLTDVIVTTDSDKIGSIAKEYNCRHFKRDESNATDHAPVELAVSELIESLDTEYDLILLLQPTAPIRESEDIDNVIQMFMDDPSLENVVSVIPLSDIHPARIYKYNQKNELTSLEPDLETARRQDLYPVYIRNGSIYGITVKAFSRENKLMLANKKTYEMLEERWLNIDTPRDVLIGEVLLKEWQKGNI